MNITDNSQIDNAQLELQHNSITAVEVSNVQPHLHKAECCTLLLLSCGTVVKTKMGKIEGMITCQSIRFDKVQYEVTYFFNNEHKTVWMSEKEFEIINDNRVMIGFVRK